jgi:hypothetical protein
MTFGLMTKKWGILSRPLSIKMKHVKHMMICIARLHNFCIDERLRATEQELRSVDEHADVGPMLFTPRNVSFDAHTQHVREIAAHIEYEDAELVYDNPYSVNRERMAQEIEALALTRPSTTDNTHRRSRKRKR